MYDNHVVSVNYNALFCHACLSPTSLSAVGEYLEIYRKICDFSRMNLTSQVNICGECMALLKKVHAFKKKVEKAQKRLDFCVNKQIPLEEYICDFNVSNTETTTLDDYPILEHENADEYMQDELMIRIEDVRGRCDITDVSPTLDLSTSSCGATAQAQPEPGSPADEERRHCQWKRTALLVYNRICSHRYAHHFLKPVSDERAPLYSRIVRRPTDLSAIKRRLKEGVIRTTAELTRALLLMFSNALFYNPAVHNIYQMTLEFREETIRELSLLQDVQAQPDGPPELRRRPSARESPAAAPELRRRPSARERPAAAPAQAARARRASLWDASLRTAPAPVLKSSHSVTRRRKSAWDASEEDVRRTAAPLRPRRKSVYQPRPAEPQEPPAEPPAKRRPKWDWPSLDNEHLVASCFRKCKSTVLL